MPLQSELFRGDRRLEACLIDNAAHITPGSVGDFVAKIQIALLTLEDLDIQPSELLAKRYGPSTAAAVLGYKTRRRIINFTYETQADNIVGKMTIESLDREMLAQEPPDTGTACYLDDALITGRPAPSPVGGNLGVVPAVVTATGTSPSDRAKGLKADAALWAAAATGKLGLVASLLANNDPNVTNTTAWRGLETHFHISTAANSATFIADLSRFYSFIEITISRAATLFVDDLTNPTDFAYAFKGRFHTDPALAQGQLHFCPEYLKLGPLMATAVIVHESAHYVDRTIDHFASELPGPHGSPVGAGHTKNYDQLNADEAKQNAYSYAQFALHMKMTFDKRLHFKRLPGGGLKTD